MVLVVPLGPLNQELFSSNWYVQPLVNWEALRKQDIMMPWPPKCLYHCVAFLADTALASRRPWDEICEGHVMKSSVNPSRSLTLCPAI